LDEALVDKQQADELDFSGEEMEQEPHSLISSAGKNEVEQSSKVVELEQVMNNGMQFLAGMFKMSTGKDLGIDNQSIEINKETGEVTMKFKLPI